MEIAPSFKRTSSDTISNASAVNAVPKQMRIMETTRAAADGMASRSLDERAGGLAGDW